MGIFYNREKAGGDITTWEEFFAIPEKTGNNITMVDDMREVMAVGLGISLSGSPGPLPKMTTCST